MTDTAQRQSQDPVYQSLKRALMCGDMKPGERLVVAHLAAAFGTSAMPVRQALQRLVGEKALDEKLHRGVEVPTLDVADLMDLRRVRCAVEGQVAEWAAQTVTPAEIDRLCALQGRMRAVADARHAGSYLEWNLEFHFTVYAAARSALFLPIIENLWLRAGPCLNVMRTEATLGLGLDSHDAVIAALQRGDGRAARAAVEDEISEAAEIMARALSPGQPRNGIAIPQPGPRAIALAAREAGRRAGAVPKPGT
jgi:DNA-binding GntR family transcriptional regulator